MIIVAICVIKRAILATCFSEKVREALSLDCDTTVIPSSSCQYSGDSKNTRLREGSVRFFHSHNVTYAILTQ